MTVHDTMSHALSRRRFIVSAAAGIAALSATDLSSALAAPPGRMKIVNYAMYVDDSVKVDAARAEHQAYADSLREHGLLVMGGPLIGADKRPRGVLLVYEVASREQAEALAQDDPFALEGAIESSRLSEWNVQDSNVGLLAASLVPADRRGAPKAAHASPAAHAARTFINYTTFVPDRSRVERLRPAHDAYARTLEARGELIMAGPFAGGTGALSIYRTQSRDDALALALADPYQAEGAIETHALSEWRLFGLNAGLIQATR